jgi:hypothetical protein
MKIARLAIAACAALFAASPAECATLLVPRQYPTIQLAIDSASNGDEIHVSPGTYHEQINLRGKSIELVGNVDGTRATIDGDGLRVCIIGSGEPVSCVVRGFVIRNGSYSGSIGGGGVSLSNSAATFRDCAFIGNAAVGDALWSGGAFHSLGGSETIEDCSFIGNRGWNQSSASAIYHYRHGSLTVRRCIFDSNKCNFLGEAGEGRGATVKVHSEFEGGTATIEACAFIGSESGSSAAYEPGSVDGEVVAFSTGTVVEVRDSTLVCGRAARPCAVSASGGATMTVSGCRGCGYDRTANGDVTVIDSDVADRCVDCNGDGVKDLEQVVRNPSLDANADGALDSCGADCNADGIDDRDQILDGTLADLDGNGIPDVCDCASSGIDSDLDGVPDCLDNCDTVPNATQADCDGDGDGDACEIAAGAADCNSNGTPDGCEDDFRVVSTGDLGRFGGAVPSEGLLAGCTVSTTPVTVRIEAIGDLNAPTEYLDLQLGGVTVRQLLFEADGHACPAMPDVAEFELPSSQWNSLVSVGSGSVTVRVVASPLVSSTECPSGRLEVRVRHGGPVFDCDGNGTADICDVGSGAGDCDGDRLLDRCEIASGAPDVDGNSIPDTCEDADADGLPDGIDPDDDNDGYGDGVDAFPQNPAEWSDADGDGSGDNGDPDDDNDGTEDSADGCPNDPSKSSPGQCGCGDPDVDSDADGVADCVDNCDAVANPAQADCDADGVGDACVLAQVLLEDDFDDGVLDQSLWSVYLPYGCSEVREDSGSALSRARGQLRSAQEFPAPDAAVATVLEFDWQDASGNGELFSAIVRTASEAGFCCGGVGDGLFFTYYGGQVAISVGGGFQGGTAASGSIMSAGTWYRVVLQYTSSTFSARVRPASGGEDIWNASIQYSGVARGEGLNFNSREFCETASRVDSVVLRSAGAAADCNANSVPDTCEISSGTAGDCDGDDLLDSCEIARGAPDCNSNGVPDACEIAGGAPDVDGNGVPDACQPDCNANGLPDPWEIAVAISPDCDSSGKPDSCDIADGASDCNIDGVPDVCQAGPGSPDDLNGNGIPDACDDTDGDGVVDTADADDDGDGFADGVDSFPFDAGEWSDADGDGSGDNGDPDDDNDGTEDSADGCPIDPSKSSPGQCGCGNPDSDIDADGVADCVDNCDTVPNPSQGDCDLDGVGDACAPAGAGYLRFDSIRDTVALSDSVVVGNSYTYEFRIRLPVPQQAEYGRIYSEQNGAETDKAVGIDTRSGFHLEMGQCCGAPVHRADASVLNDGNWHHLALVRRPNSWSMYVDGVELSRQNSYGSPGGSVNSMRSIGAFRYQYHGGDPTAFSVIMDIDWMRVSTIARYDGAMFQPPVVDELAVDPATGLLFRFDAPPAGWPLSYVSEGSGIVGTFGQGFPSATSPEFLEAGAFADCNANGAPDDCEITGGLVPDCNSNGVPDSCDVSISGSDLDSNGVPDACQPDCNGNALPDAWEVATGLVPDCDANAEPDSCDLAGGAPDCDANAVPDSCDIVAGAMDKDQDGRIDDCEYSRGDFDLDGQIGGADLPFLLFAWGTSSTAADLDRSGIVDGADLTQLLSWWGPLP